MSLDDLKIKGNPKVYHWDCAYKACEGSRDRLAQLNQASQARRTIVSENVFDKVKT